VTKVGLTKYVEASVILFHPNRGGKDPNAPLQED